MVNVECGRDEACIQKREIWESTETGAGSEARFEDYTSGSIDMDLESDLMYHLIEHLSPQT